MIDIEWSLDQSEPIDLVDLLGSIRIVDGHGHEILEQITFLDSWFDGLIRGFIGLASATNVEIDLYDEPHHLTFFTSGDELTLAYGSEQVHPGSISDFHTVLRQSASGFIDALRAYGNVNDQVNLKSILAWLND